MKTEAQRDVFGSYYITWFIIACAVFTCSVYSFYYTWFKTLKRHNLDKSVLSSLHNGLLSSAAITLSCHFPRFCSRYDYCTFLKNTVITQQSTIEMGYFDYYVKFIWFFLAFVITEKCTHFLNSAPKWRIRFVANKINQNWSTCDKALLKQT